MWFADMGISKQILLNASRNELPVQGIEGALWRRHAHAARALGALGPLGTPPAGTAPRLPPPPPPCEGMARLAAPSGPAVPLPRLVPVGQRRRALGRPRPTPAGAPPHARWPG